MTMLRSVNQAKPEAPYPEDTKANGFRQEIDIDRITQSRTWILADKEVRPWLLMLWLGSWKNVPCGSWDADDEYIAKSIGCKVEWFAGHREKLLRGWKLHADGRLYHEFITEQVMEMLSRRKKSTERQRKRRTVSSVSHTAVTRDSQGTYDKEQEQEQELKEVVLNSTTTQNSAPKPREKVPYQKIAELWAEVLPELPRPVKLSDARKKHIRSRWQDELPDLDSWRECFQHIRKSAFLMGKTQGRNGGPPFVASLDWVAKQENLLKIYEGKYHRG